MPAYPTACFDFSARLVALTGAEAACALGESLSECAENLSAGKDCLRALAESGLACAGSYPDLRAGWIPGNRRWIGRRYGTATHAALRSARALLDQTAWDEAERREAWLWVGTSRGNAGETAGAWKSRRPVGKFAASNSLHSEIAAAISIELGIGGPWQVLANGCAAGLDALGHAALAVAQGWTPRALVVAVDLPLIPPLLDAFASTGLLARSGPNDPYSPATQGFIPAEGVAAVTLEARPVTGPWCSIRAYAANSDAYDAIGLPSQGEPLAGLISHLLATLPGESRLHAICPHATGTATHRISESAALDAAFPDIRIRPPLLPLKPATGHTLGASGLLDIALLAHALRDGSLPPAGPDLTPPGPGWHIHGHPLPCPDHSLLLKIAAGMGGHNAGILLET